MRTREEMNENVASTENVNVPESVEANSTGYEFDTVDDSGSNESIIPVGTSKTIAILPFYKRIVKGVKRKDGKPIFNHFAYTREKIGNDNHEIFAFMDPSDIGGYGLLELIFLVCKTAKLVVTENHSKDTNGNERTYFSYEVFSTNSEGAVYSCPVKLHSKSDKAYLDIVIRNENTYKEE